MSSRFAVCAALLAFSSAALAQTSDPAWLDDLTFQLKADKECEVTYVMNLREGQLAGEPTYEARVQCADGRMFDASRIGRNADFVFKACDTQVC